MAAKRKRLTKLEIATREAFHEVKHNPPRILKKTKRKQGAEAARKQAIAIALNKGKRAATKKKSNRLEKAKTMQFKTLQDEKNFNRYYREVLDHIDDLATIPGPNPSQDYVYKIYAKGYEAKACARRYVREEKLGDLHVVGRRMR